MLRADPEQQLAGSQQAGTRGGPVTTRRRPAPAGDPRRFMRGARVAVSRTPPDTSMSREGLRRRGGDFPPLFVPISAARPSRPRAGPAA
ncbi:hypothetical protein [Lysobacter gummosus]|uniref:hypothetical protein n=1 Tax=Lysobacter gummosus TaxID=262324 RepID=UPI0036457717